MRLVNILSICILFGSALAAPMPSEDATYAMDEMEHAIRTLETPKVRPTRSRAIANAPAPLAREKPAVGPTEQTRPRSPAGVRLNPPRPHLSPNSPRLDPAPATDQLPDASAQAEITLPNLKDELESRDPKAETPVGDDDAANNGRIVSPSKTKYKVLGHNRFLNQPT